MTRRPYAPHAQRVARASQNLTAPGKAWSESPTTRLGPTRKPRTAASTAVVCDPAQYYDQWAEFEIIEGDTAITFDWSEWWFGPFEDGRLALALAAGVGVGWSPPSGWTVVLNDSIGDLGYCLAWKIMVDPEPPPEDWNITGLSPGWTYGSAPDSTGAAMVQQWLVGSATAESDPFCTGLTLSVASVETASATSVTLPAVSSDLSEPFQFLLGLPNTSTAPAHARDINQGSHPSPWVTQGYPYPAGGSTISPLWFYARINTSQMTTLPITVGMWSDTSPSMTTPLLAEWVSITLGWA